MSRFKNMMAHWGKYRPGFRGSRYRPPKVVPCREGGPKELSPRKIFIEVLRNWISDILRPSQRVIMSGFLYQLVDHFSIFSSFPYLTL